MYLLVHGSVSLWFRLKWLCDIPLISNNGIIFGQTDFQKKTSSLGIERMTTQGIFLANNMLSMPCSHEVLQHYENDKQVHFISAIAKRNLATYNLDLGLFEKSKYLFLFAIKYMPVLRKDYSYKVNHVRSYLTRTTDWEVLALPDYLFFLYYPLRPFLWLKRQL